ncbi:gastric triacylglycerol lipase-like [Zophobas morio]|uniref:gastric triacylglycerol lipase-like n=1 Tax=Zophobas morio TaxID=2755281 RepID=UPI0030838C82
MFLIFVPLIVLCSTATTGFSFHRENNACPRLIDYPVKAFSSRCYVNPNPDMIKQNGYKCGTYKVVSEDGYTSLIFRVLPREDDGGGKGQPIILEHGIEINSAAWTWMGNRSLGSPFVLAKAGYDVWLVNQRDSGYTTHNKYKTSDSRFWANSLDDYASKGEPAILKTVAAETNKSGSIIFIGHSRATITSFMYMSENPQEAEKFIRGVVALSPAAYLDFSFHFRIVARLSPLILNIIPVTVKRIFEELGSSEKEYHSVPIGVDDKRLQFGHDDFIWSRYIEELFYKDLFKVLNKLKPKG